MSVETSGSVSYRRLFAVPGFAQLAAGTVLARTAGQLWQIALVLFVLQRYHSPALAGIASFLSLAPGLAISPIAGALLDRQGRLRMILLDYAVAAGALVSLFGLGKWSLLSPPLLLVIVTISSLTGPLSASGIRTMFPLVVPRDLWDRANGIDSGSFALALVLGPALGGALVAWIGGEGAFLVTAGIFVVAGAALIGITDPHVAHVQPSRLLHAAWEGLLYVVRHTTLRGILLTMLVGNIAYGVLLVALPVLVLDRFHWGAEVVGELWAVAGVTTVAAGLLAGRMRTAGRERWFIAVGMGLGGVACAVLLFAGSAPWLVVAMLLLGISSGPVDIGIFALRQRRTDPRWFGRAFAVSMSLNFAGVPLGSALGGGLVERSMPLALGIAILVSLVACVVPFVAIPRHG